MKETRNTFLNMGRILATLVIAVIALPFSQSQPIHAQILGPENNEAWLEIKEEVFDDHVVVEDTLAIELTAPYRAEDAAIVPISVRIAPKLGVITKKLTLIIDQNPMPVVGQFIYGPASGKGEKYLSIRVRINDYSNVRAVVETIDGQFFMASKFVKASGGCSAPALKDADAAQAALGQIRIKELSVTAASGLSLGQLMIRHPQYSGFQMNQSTGHYIPAEFVSEMQVKHGGVIVFTMTGGISISEDPNFRFSYLKNGSDGLSITATDTKDRSFSAQSARKVVLSQER